MNQPNNPNSLSNVVRPNGDNRPRGSDITDPPGTGNAPGARIVASPATASGTSSATSTPTPAFNGSTPATPVGSTANATTAVNKPAASSAAPSEDAPALLNKVVQGAHDTVDRIAESAAPVARRLGERVSATEDALHASTDHLRQVRDEWTAGARAKVRDNPLAYVAGALALGALIARLRR